LFLCACVTTESSAAVGRAQVRRVGRADRRVGRAGVHGAVREREAAPGGGQVRGAGCAARAVAAGGRRVEARPSKDPFRVQGTYTVISLTHALLCLAHVNQRVPSTGGVVWYGISLINATLRCTVMRRCLDVSFPSLPRKKNVCSLAARTLGADPTPDRGHVSRKFIMRPGPASMLSPAHPLPGRR